MTIDRNATVTSYLQRLDTFHLDGGPSAFVDICKDICASSLEGTNSEFTRLWERIVEEKNKLNNFNSSTYGRKAVLHIFQEKDRVAPHAIEVEPGLHQVRIRRKR